MCIVDSAWTESEAEIAWAPVSKVFCEGSCGAKGNFSSEILSLLGGCGLLSLSKGGGSVVESAVICGRVGEDALTAEIGVTAGVLLSRHLHAARELEGSWCSCAAALEEGAVVKEGSVASVLCEDWMDVVVETSV